MTGELERPTDMAAMALTARPDVDLAEWVQRASDAKRLATGLIDTFFVPETYKAQARTEEGRNTAILNATGAILLGSALGVDPLTALNNIYMIKNRPGMYSRFKVALVQSRGHEIWTEAESPESVTVCGRRRGTDHIIKVTITIEHARAAGWLSNSNYRTVPQDMLYARAAGRVADRIAADDLLGIGTAEDLRDIPDAPSEPATVTVTKDAILSIGRRPTEPEAEVDEAVRPDVSDPVAAAAALDRYEGTKFISGTAAERIRARAAEIRDREVIIDFAEIEGDDDDAA